MNKQTSLRWINIVLAIVFILLTSSALLEEIIPEELYEKIHPLLGFIMVLLVLAHLVLNWSWVKNNLFKTAGKSSR